MQSNGFIDTRKIWGILGLDKKYTAGTINEACERAISIEAYSYRTILSFLELGTAESVEPEDIGREGKDTMTSKFVRPIEEYKQLLKFEEENL